MGAWDAMPLPLFAALAALVGLVVGSFLNVVAARLPVMMLRRDATRRHVGLLRPPSHCPRCGHRLTWRELIPVASWLIQRGRCRACGTAISAGYPAVEALAAGAAALTAVAFGPGWPAVVAILLSWALLVAAVIDLRHHLLPDSIILPGLWAGLVIAATTGWFVPPATAILGAAAGYLALWAVYHGHRAVTGRAGLGRGDFKLLGLWGAWLGWEPLPWVVLIAACGALAFAATQMARDRIARAAGGRLRVALGPFLAFGGWAVLLAGGVL